MNKKLLALAIGAAVVMPVAALADGPTLYGKINLSLENQVTNAGTANAPDNTNNVVANNQSRIGLKGTLPTSKDGVDGIYNAEFDLAADGDGGPLTSRNIYAGVKGGWGKLTVGNIDTPTRSLQGSVDQFNDSTLDIDAYVPGENRAKNVVIYTSPKFGEAVTIAIASWQGENMYQPQGGGALVNSNGAAPLPAGATHYDGLLESVSATIAYDNENLHLGVGMDKEINDALLGEPMDAMRVVGTYNNDSLSLGLLYQTAEVSVGNTELTSLVLGGAYTSGAYTWKLQHGNTEVEMGAVSQEGTLIAVGLDYALGKTTKLYGMFGKTDGIFDATGPVGASNTGNGLMMLGGNKNAEATVMGLGLDQRF